MKFLDALNGVNKGRPPLWLMRQAGRYLPEYQELRAKHSLRDLFFTPELAATATLQPIQRFGFDAAILFSDITAIAPAMGFDLQFREGPQVFPFATRTNWRGLKQDRSLLAPIAKAAACVKQSVKVPLIGFCGGPFTIATYLAENVDEWMQTDPDDFDEFLNYICDVCIDSLQRQIEAGVDAVQIFDSWANRLQGEQFGRWSLRYLRKIAASSSVPAIVYMRGSGKRAEQLAAMDGVCLSIDENRTLSDVRRAIKAPLQGNFDPDLLFAPEDTIRRTVRALLDDMQGDPAFIVNLGHGVKPGTPLLGVQALVEEVLRG